VVKDRQAGNVFDNRESDLKNNTLNLSLISQAFPTLQKVDNASEKLHKELLQGDPDESKKTLAIVQNKYDRTYVVYEKCAAVLGEQIQALTSERKQEQQNIASQGCRLPPCDTEVFDGNYLRWPTFRDLFTAVYIKNPRLTPVERLFHLSAKTSGEPNEIVSRSPLTNDGFQSAWDGLIERYENPRSLINSHLKLLFSVSSIATESGFAIKGLQSTFQGCLTALSHFGVDTKSWDCLLVFLCSSKLPDSTLTLWE